MHSETQEQTKQLTSGERQVLCRIQHPSTLTELRERCERAVAAGFDGVELALDVGESGRSLLGWGREPPAFNGLVEHDVTISAVAARCIATDIDEAAAEVSSLLNRAASLGAQCLNLTIPPIAKLEHGGAPAEGDISLGHATQSVPQRDGFASYQEALNLAYQLLHRVRMDAEGSGVVVALEAGRGGCLLSPVELREIIDAANSWAVGACVDAAHVARFSSPADWIRTLAGRLYAVRLEHRVQTDAAEVVDGLPSTRTDKMLHARAINDALNEIRYDRLVITVSEAIS